MITELAPIDLLIQRAGRLRRHEGRERPEYPPCTPVLHIIDSNEITSDTWSVYDPYILKKTHLVLPKEVEEPLDVRDLIENTYCPPDKDTELLRMCAEWNKSLDGAKRKANSRVIKSVPFLRIPSLYQYMFPDELQSEKSPLAAVRDTQPSLKIAILKSKGSGIVTGVDSEANWSIDLNAALDKNQIKNILSQSFSVSFTSMKECEKAEEELKEDLRLSSLTRNGISAVIVENPEHIQIGSKVFKYDEFKGLVS